MTLDQDSPGGRHQAPPPPEGGGRYLDIYKIFGDANRRAAKNRRQKFKITIEDLKGIGLSGKWLEIAEHVGVDTWLQIWEILDRENIDLPARQRDRIRIWIPSYSKLIKHARNRYIKKLTDEGKNPRQIYRELKKLNLEPVSIGQILAIQSEIKGEKTDE